MVLAVGDTNVVVVVVVVVDVVVVVIVVVLVVWALINLYLVSLMKLLSYHLIT